MFKQAEPECLKSASGKEAGGSFAELRKISQQMLGGAPAKPAGPLANAFMTTNPVLPKDYFAPKAGIDKFVLDLNKGIDNSLLDCKGRYSVKIATFTGKVVIDQRKINEIEHGKDLVPHDKAHDNDPLHYAAAKAHALTEALRKKGFEAYEFHDRYSSIVTIGSFNTVGSPRPDGKTEINPQIHEIMKTFGPDPSTMPKDGGANGLGQKSVQVTIDKEKKSVLLDVQPIPVEVPRRSIGSDYQQASFFRYGITLRRDAVHEVEPRCRHLRLRRFVSATLAGYADAGAGNSKPEEGARAGRVARALGLRSENARRSARVDRGRGNGRYVRRQRGAQGLPASQASRSMGARRG